MFEFQLPVHVPRVTSSQHMPAIAMATQVGNCRYKEEAEGALQESREQLAAAHEERHALERQARHQVRPLSLFQLYLVTMLAT